MQIIVEVPEECNALAEVVHEVADRFPPPRIERTKIKWKVKVSSVMPLSER